MAKYLSKLVSVGVAGAVAGNAEGENAGAIGAGNIGPATGGKAKLDDDAELTNSGRTGQAEDDAGIAGQVGNVELDDAGNAEPENAGKGAGKIGSAFSVLAALVSALVNDRKALSILSAFWKNKLSR